MWYKLLTKLWSSTPGKQECSVATSPAIPERDNSDASDKDKSNPDSTKTSGALVQQYSIPHTHHPGISRKSFFEDSGREDIMAKINREKSASQSIERIMKQSGNNSAVIRVIYGQIVSKEDGSYTQALAQSYNSPVAFMSSTARLEQNKEKNAKDMKEENEKKEVQRHQDEKTDEPKTSPPTPMSVCLRRCFPPCGNTHKRYYKKDSIHTSESAIHPDFIKNVLSEKLEPGEETNKPPFAKTPVGVKLVPCTLKHGGRGVVMHAYEADNGSTVLWNPIFRKRQNGKWAGTWQALNGLPIRPDKPYSSDNLRIRKDEMDEVKRANHTCIRSTKGLGQWAPIFNEGVGNSEEAKNTDSGNTPPRRKSKDASQTDAPSSDNHDDTDNDGASKPKRRCHDAPRLPALPTTEVVAPALATATSNTDASPEPKRQRDNETPTSATDDKVDEPSPKRRRYNEDHLRTPNTAINVLAPAPITITMTPPDTHKRNIRPKKVAPTLISSSTTTSAPLLAPDMMPAYTVKGNNASKSPIPMVPKIAAPTLTLTPPSDEALPQTFINVPESNDRDLSKDVHDLIQERKAQISRREHPEIRVHDAWNCRLAKKPKMKKFFKEWQVWRAREDKVWREQRESEKKRRSVETTEWERRKMVEEVSEWEERTGRRWECMDRGFLEG